MKLVLLAAIFLSLVACSNDSSSDSTDPIYGDWYYEVPGSTSTQAYGIIGNISKDGTIQFMNAYGVSDGNSAKFYVRKSNGTYTRNGNEFKVAYSYETCDPVGSETLYISVSGGKLIVQNSDKSFQLVLARASSTTTLTNMVFIEDKNCNILATLEKGKKRNVASVKSKSFFDRAIK